MDRTIRRFRAAAPDLGLAAVALAVLAGAGAALTIPVLHYTALVVAALGSMYLGRRVLGSNGRTAIETLATGAIVYGSGWGPALALAFVAPLLQAVGRSGSAAVRAATCWSLVAVGLGQAAIAAGVAPSYVEATTAHAVAAVGAVALLAVARRLRATTLSREQAEAAATHGRERYRALVQHSTDVVLVLDSDGRIREQGPSVSTSLGYRPNRLEGVTYASLAHEDDAPRITEAIYDLTRGAAPALVEARLRRADGAYLPVEIAWSDLRSHPAVRAIVAHARDISDRRTLEAALEHRAYHDALTGLSNRSKFSDRVEHAVARAGRRPQRFAVLFLDLDGFKDVNDTLGHDAGDALLVEVATRIGDAVRDVDTPARFGGDEFAVLLEDLRDDADAVRVAERILSTVRRPIVIDGAAVHVDCSIGIAVSTGTESANELLRNADVAMYSAKNAGKGCYELFEPAMHLDAVARLEAERSLALAIGNDELVVHYQPIVALDDERVVGVEALVRWRHPERGLIGPGEFIPMAEETGLIVPLGRWVLTTACGQVATWQRRMAGDAAPLRLSINVSPRQLLSGDLVADVARALAASGLAPQSLTLEITESSVIEDSAATLHTLRELKYLGVQLAIDDFGTGYSALSYLQRFPFDELKIDRSFVAGLTDGSADPTLVRAIIDIAHALDLRTVAEGLEYPEQVSRTRQLRCELGQGYHFARPADAATTQLLLEPLWDDKPLKSGITAADITSHMH